MQLLLTAVHSLTLARAGTNKTTVRYGRASRARLVQGAVWSCATIVGGSPRGILDLMCGRGRGSLGVVDGPS